MALNGLARWMAGGFSNSRALSQRDIEMSLERLCTPPPPVTFKELTPPIAPGNFVQITLLLQALEKHNGKKGWECRPRLYAVLRMIGRQDAMDDFIQAGLYDLHLPFEPVHLPGVLGSDKTQFCRKQNIVCTKAREIELGLEHGNLSTPGDNHFAHAGYLGAGGYGEVDVVLSRLSSRYFARKKFLRRGNARETRELFSMYAREINALKRLRHRHLVEIVGTYTDPQCFAFLMWPIAERDMNSFLNAASSNPKLMPELRSHFGCLASTIAYLHSERVCHMDLKLGNILIDRGKIRVADFGTAHDWSANGRSTTNTPMAHTSFYIPPELGRNGGAPRNAATDMWSLGVVFLEMISVLRGQTVAQFRRHLRASGTLHSFVWSNTVATFSWFELLQESQFGPLSDNEPLTWIRDLLNEQPHNRPSAEDLKLHILRSPSVEQWRQICCAHEDGGDPIELATKPGVDRGSSARDSGYFFDSETEDTRKSRHIDATTHSTLDWQSKIGQNEYQTLPGAWADDEALVGDNEHSIDTSDPRTTILESPATPYSWQPEGAVIDSTEVPWDITEDHTGAFANYAHQDSFTQRLQDFDFLDQPAPDYQDRRGELGDYDDEEKFEIDDDGSSCSSEVTVRPFSDTTEGNDGERSLGSVRDWAEGGDEPKVWAGQPLASPITDASKPLPAIKSEGFEGSGFYPKSKSNAGSNLVAHRKSPNQVWTSASNEESGPTTVLSQQSTQPMQTVPKLKKPPKESPGNVDPVKAPRIEVFPERLGKSLEHFMPPIEAAKPTTKAKKQESQGTANIEPATKADVPTIGNPRDRKQHNTTTTGTDASIKPQSTKPLTSKNLNTLLGQQTNKAPSLGTEDITSTAAVHIPNNTRPSPRVLGISASKYIQEVYQAESEAATSIVSSATRQKLSGSIGLTRWLDHDNNLLGAFAKQGEAGSVRLCLEKKCNPGTVAKPRPGPLLAAVHGRSARHNKCVRVLLEYGADPNVRRRGKPALHVAIEHEYFKGYCNLIMMLLQNGADPDATDSAGDTALHKILSGGYDVLPKYKRDAMALLMWFDADVRHGPKSTLVRPLHLAVRRNDPWAVAFVLEKGAAVGDRDGAGQTAWAIVVSGGNGKNAHDRREVVRQLLHYGANVNEGVGILENTALHNAVSSGDEEMVRILVAEKGFDMAAKNTAGLTAQDALKAAFKQGKMTSELHGKLRALLNPCR